MPPASSMPSSPVAIPLPWDRPAESPNSLPQTSRAIIRLRKNSEGQIINRWLILTMLVGAVISVADGLSRPPDFDLEPLPQSVQYDPYTAVFLFAGLTLPLLFAYGRRARISVTETLFLWFLFGTTAYSKDFAYIRLPGVPLFITDVVLIVLLTSIYIVQRRRGPRLPVALNLSLVFFVLAGVLAAARGFWEHHNSVLVLRDSAIVGYALFLPAGYHLAKNWLMIKRVAAWFALGAALSVLNGLAQFAVVPDQRRFVSGIYVLVPFVGVLVLMANRLIRPRLGWILAGVFSVGLFLANSRSDFVALLVLFVLALLVPGLFRRKLRLLTSITAIGAAAVLAGSIAFLYLHLRSERAFAVRVAGEMSSGLLHTNQDPYWQFRVKAWHEAWSRFKQYPAAGEGFGVPFTFDIWDEDVRPHNTFLTVLYKMGLLGFLPLLVFLSSFFWLGLHCLRRNQRNDHVVFLQILILSLICFCVWGGASLMLESPYLASLFWLGMGISLRLAQKLDFERSFRGLANSESRGATPIALGSKP